MSQGTKNRTMIRTNEPIVPPPAPASGPQRSHTAPPHPAPSAGLPYQASTPAAPTIMPASSAPGMAPAISTPTIGMRPRPEPAAGAPIGGDDPDGFVGQELCGY